jgi:hypothetical protein
MRTGGNLVELEKIANKIKNKNTSVTVLDWPRLYGEIIQTP